MDDGGESFRPGQVDPPANMLLFAQFADDFESAVLHALNGGGPNQARCILTGALVGAQVGFSGIPQRILDGLDNAGELIVLARRLGGTSRRRKRRFALRVAGTWPRMISQVVSLFRGQEHFVTSTEKPPPQKPPNLIILHINSKGPAL